MRLEEFHAAGAQRILGANNLKPIALHLAGEDVRPGTELRHRLVDIRLHSTIEQLGFFRTGIH